MAVEPYQVAVPDDRLADLRARLAAARYPDELDGAGWQLGAPLAEVKRLAAYWRDDYDWRAAEARINATLPQYRTRIQPAGFEAIDIHFVHVRSGLPDAIPLLFVHGWPGSFLEVGKLIAPLCQASDVGRGAPAFDLVAPSLPNYGFSSGVAQRGFGLAQYAEVCDALMRRLGYEAYATQGGDWGFYITRTLGLLYPERVRASHINMVRADPPRWLSSPAAKLREQLAGRPSAADRAGFERSRWFQTEGQGYRFLQSTKPQTIGYALADSPVALLAWLLEKLHDWTDGYAWEPDEILTWVSVYWFSTAGPAANMRIYYEATHAPPPAEVARLGRTRFVHRDRASQWIPGVKLGVARFPRELSVVPNNWARTLGPLVYASDNARGGHFAATEMPEAIARDLRAMFGRGGGAFGCIEGRSGYADKPRL